MTDLFAGAPESWLRATGDDAHQQLTPEVLNWVHKNSRQNSPEYMRTLQAIHAFKANPVLPGQSDPSGALAWDTIRANKEAADRQAVADAKANATHELLARHADPNWQRPPQFGADFDQWARSKVGSQDDAFRRVAGNAMDSLGSFAGQLSGNGQE